MIEDYAYVTATDLAFVINGEIRALTVHNTPNVRSVRRKYSGILQQREPAFILELAGILIQNYGYRGMPYELVRFHRSTFQSLGLAEIESLGQGIDSWWSVDSFARVISGPAWLKGLVNDGLVHNWAQSSDRWWRRAALVSTVALNLRSQGGFGDTVRTLAVCDAMISDRDDMVVKAMSWALRELAVPDPEAVRAYLKDHEDQLAARVRREVRNKLDTGLKNPRRKATKR
ncbi:MAG: DNA alkylation repair protein [Candidatus Promineifilaceae bacterium]